MLADGRLHLSAVARLAPHLTAANARAVLERAAHRSKREILELVAELAPRPDVPAAIRALPRREAGGATKVSPANGQAASPKEAVREWNDSRIVPVTNQLCPDRVGAADEPRPDRVAASGSPIAGYCEPAKATATSAIEAAARQRAPRSSRRRSACSSCRTAS